MIVAQKIFLRMKLIFFIILFGCIFVSPVFASVEELNLSVPSASFEQGEKYSKNAIQVIDLHGTWRDMGRQYGKLMSSSLTNIWSAKLQPYMLKHPDKAVLMKKIANNHWQACPYKYRETMTGIAETSGLSLEQVNMVNMVERVAGITQCSALAVWGNYASDGLVYGRNYDFFPSFQILSKDIVVSVYHPADGSLAVATIGYAGEIYAVNALNEAGLFVELNNGSPSGNKKRASDRIHATLSLFSMMQDADSLNYLDRFFATTQCNASYIIGATDGKTARSYEWDVDGVQRGDTVSKPGVMVMTNHFVSPIWQRPEPTDEASWQSVTRRNNLLNLAEEFKGKIDATQMMELMNRDISAGGSKSKLTRYELTLQPQNKVIWLKIPEESNWTKIDMKHLFQKQTQQKTAA
jgi:hypothetical protein